MAINLLRREQKLMIIASMAPLFTLCQVEVGDRVLTINVLPLN